MQEIWKDIKGYEGKYQISNLGRVKSLQRNGRPERILRLNLIKGYAYTTLSNGSRGNKKKLKVHRLVAEAFIPNPHNKPEVNHIDGNKLNNNVDNLEWVTHQENCKHAVKLGLRKIQGAKTIEQYSKDGKLIATYSSINEASQILNINRVMISNVIRGVKKSTHNFIFKEVVENVR